MAARKKSSFSAGRELRATFRRSGERDFEGHVVDPADPERKFVVELLIDGYPSQVTRADHFVDELAEAGIGDGCYGYGFTLDQRIVDAGSVFEARVANTATSLGPPIISSSPHPTKTEISAVGEVQWLHGLRLRGWLAQDKIDAASVKATIDGEVVAIAQASGWTHLGATRAVRAFDLQLPTHMADGRVHRVRVLAEGGQELRGSPLTIVSFADGLAQAVASMADIESERLRAEQFDRLFPASIPFSDYDHWAERFPLQAPASAARSIAIVLVGDGDLDVSLDSLEERGDAEWCAAAMPPRNNQVSFDPQLVLQFLNGEAAACDIVLFAIAGTRFSATALPRILSAFSKFPEATAVYGDLEIRNDDGRRWPIAFPAFDYERMLEQGYCGYVPAFRRSAVDALLGAGCSDLYRLFNALFDATGTAGASIVHIPGALACLPPIDAPSAARALAAAGSAHLQARGIAAEVTVSEGGAFPAVHVKRAIAPASVSIIIPTRNRSELLQTCIESIRPAATALGAEIIVIDNDSTEPEALAYLAKIDGSVARVIRVEGPFNFARHNNLAVEAARGDHLCLLNNDVEALDNEWLTEMMSRIAEPDVGAVGAMLIWPSGVVQHGGVVLGPSFAAAHAFNDRTDDDPGYADLLCVAHQCSAVTAACLMVRRTDYLAVGGMDAVRFPVNFNDVDLCLKLAALGKRIVFTPHARLLHVESASRGSDDIPERAARFRREITNLRNRWGEVLIDDPYYSPMLSLDPVPFSALAWPPRSMAPRVSAPPKAVEVPPGI